MLLVVSLKIVSVQMLWSSVLLLCISAFGEHKWRERLASGDCVSRERVFVIDFSCASRVFLRVLGFSFLNTLRVRLYKLEGFLESCSLSKGLHVLLLVSC